jgi:L-fucose mutarotase
MLKGIDPLLTPELLKIMMEMGHDDALVLADANFTAMRIAAGKPVIRLPGSSMLQVVRAITALLPLVTDVTHPAGFMAVSGSAPDYRSAMQREVIELLAPQLLAEQSVEPIERFAFYERARAAYAIVLTGEKQPFGNFILRKGVIGETLRP